MGYRLKADQREFLSRQEGVSAPVKAIGDIIAHFGKAAEALQGASDGDFFELKEIVHHQKQDMQCLCGRAIKHMYVVSHVALNVELGLGSECFKYFFTDLTAAKMKHKLEAFELFCSELEQAIDRGGQTTDPETLLLKEWKLLSTKQERRLEFGLPLTQVEKHLLFEKMEILKSFLNKEKRELAHKLLKPYREITDQTAFQYVMGLLEDGTPVRSLEDLKSIPLETLQKRIQVHMAASLQNHMAIHMAASLQNHIAVHMAESTNQPEAQETREANNALEAKSAQLANMAMASEVEEVLVAITAKRLSLSLRAQENLSTLLENLENTKNLDHNDYVNCLLSTETRLILNNMVNQLNLPYSLLR